MERRWVGKSLVQASDKLLQATGGGVEPSKDLISNSVLIAWSLNSIGGVRLPKPSSFAKHLNLVLGAALGATVMPIWESF